MSRTTEQAHHPNDPSKKRDLEQGGRLDQRRGLNQVRPPSILPDDLSVDDFLSKGVRFQPRNDEAEILERIEQHIQDNLGEGFERADRIIDHLREMTSKKMASDDGVVYAVERSFDRMTGQDYEVAIYDLGFIIYDLQKVVSKLYMQAQLAYNIWDDEYWENYNKADGDTINDKIAVARKNTKSSRYRYFFTYYYWKIVSSRLDQLVEMRKMIEFSSQRQLRREQ